MSVGVRVVVKAVAVMSGGGEVTRTFLGVVSELNEAPTNIHISSRKLLKDRH